MPSNAASSELAGLRLVEVPDAAPPYDGQARDGGPAQGDGAHGDGAHGDGAHGDGAHGGRAALAGGCGPGPGPGPGPGWAAAAGTGGLGAAGGGPATALAVVIVEALAGARPERQLVPLATDRVRARIRRLAPLLRCDQRPRVLRILASQPAPRVVEMTVVATFGPRWRALALRFEHAAAHPATPGRPTRPARWRCTAIEAG